MESTFIDSQSVYLIPTPQNEFKLNFVRERDHLEVLGVDGRIILKRIFRK
jgi:hypothetical protein